MRSALLRVIERRIDEIAIQDIEEIAIQDLRYLLCVWPQLTKRLLQSRKDMLALAGWEAKLKEGLKGRLPLAAVAAEIAANIKTLVGGSLYDCVFKSFGDKASESSSLPDFMDKVVQEGLPLLSEPSWSTHTPFKYTEERVADEALLALTVINDVDTSFIFEVIRARFNKISISPRPKLWLVPTSSGERALVGYGEPAEVRSIIKDISSEVIQHRYSR